LAKVSSESFERIVKQNRRTRVKELHVSRESVKFLETWLLHVKQHMIYDERESFSQSREKSKQSMMTVFDTREAARKSLITDKGDCISLTFIPFLFAFNDKKFSQQIFKDHVNNKREGNILVQQLDG